MSPIKGFVTAQEASELCGLSPRTLTRYAEREVIKGEKVGKLWLFREAAIRNLKPLPMGRPRKKRKYTRKKEK